ncbi:8930_t:CDS:2, partial [Gigaspora margarita]
KQFNISTSNSWYISHCQNANSMVLYIIPIYDPAASINLLIDILSFWFCNSLVLYKAKPLL